MNLTCCTEHNNVRGYQNVQKKKALSFLRLVAGTSNRHLFGSRTMISKLVSGITH